MPIFKIFSKKVILTLVGIIILACAIFVSLSIAPRDFPVRKIVSVKSGQYLSTIATNLEKEKIIKSQFLLKIFVVFFSGHRQALAGDYLFDKPQSVIRIAYRLVNGEQGLTKYKVTIMEGMTVKQIANAINKSIPAFDSETFLVLAKPYEGFLFPDSYFFYESVSPDSVVEQLRGTFQQKIKTQLLSMQAFNKPLEDVIIMASIVEKEANKMEDRKIIAGILWKRIEIGMPLQVDAPFYYTLGKDSASLTKSDLTTDTPYNTYTNRGLPPTAIGNPGLGAIEATVHPTKTNYLFYLSDSKGITHYAVDHDGHVENKNKYLR